MFSPKPSMTIKELLSLDLSESVSIFNHPFLYVGRSELVLDDESKVYWLYSDEDELLSVSPEEEELVLFEKLEDEFEQDETVFFRGKEYEFNYENAGRISTIDGETDTEVEDRYVFTEYQALEGERLRIISNENTGEILAYLGRIVSEEDLTEL